MSATDPISIAPVQSPPVEIQYLLPHEESFWRWSPDGRAIEWRDGRTIAFREEIVAILKRLAPSGFPPFGAIVMLLAATRENWGQYPGNVDRLLAGYTELSEVTSLKRRTEAEGGGRQLIISAVAGKRARQELADLAGDLEAITTLPPELRASAAAVRALAEMVFAGDASPHLPPDSALAAVHVIANKFDPEYVRWSSGRDPNYAILADEIGALAAGLGRTNAESLKQWMRTGLEQSIRPAEIEIPSPDRVRGLLKDLRTDAELAGLARLAQEVLAAIHLPRALSAPEDLPVGGVSDIANRGPLDRLLLSELAYDDLTLAVRVAQGEALYLRRESPAQHPPVGRAILIDSGIRTWGVPRLYGTAVALALAASADPRGEFSVHRALNASIEEVDLLTKAGLMQHLEVLGPSPHPGSCLGPWLDQLRDLQDAAPGELDAFIVTQRETLSDPEFCRELASHQGQDAWHVATVARDGSFTLWLVSRSGKREICSAQLDLEAILVPPQGSASGSPLLHGDSRLPVVLNMYPFPLLLPAQVQAAHAVASPKFGLLGISGDRRLLRWQSAVKGAEQLAAGLPAGRIEGIFADDDHGLVNVVISRKRLNKLYLITSDLKENRCQHREFNRNRPQHVCSHQGLVVLVYANEVRVLTPYGTDERVIPYREAQMRWLSERFFTTPNGIYALSAGDGQFEFVTGRHSYAMFDRQGHGPWALFKDGDVGPAAGDPIYVKRGFGKGFAIKRLVFAPAGNRVLMQITYPVYKDSGCYLLDLDSTENWNWRRLGHTEAVDAAYASLVWPSVGWSMECAINIRNHFYGAFPDESGDLALQTRRGHALIRISSNGDLQLHDSVTPAGKPGRGARYAAFQPAHGPADAGFSLKVATWKDGSRAYLDSRGMLHLVSSDRRLPQLTITLSSAAIAGWSSNGLTFGWTYFLPGAATSDPQTAAAILRQFCGRLR